MLIDVVFIVLGLLGLFLGGKWLVIAASNLALSFGVSHLVVGLTVVAVGTSAPELFTNVTAALAGSTELALGNVIGSNVANIGLILGLTGLIASLVVKEHQIKKHIGVMAFITLLVALMAFDGGLARLEGIFLLLSYIGYTIYAFRSSSVDSESTSTEEPRPAVGRLRETSILFAGLIVLTVGARGTVEGAVGLASSIGISEALIGVTVVAFGTSLPELAASISAIRQGHAGLAVGNAVGSNIANLMLVLGATAVIAPITVSPDAMRFGFAAMLVFVVALFLMLKDRKLGRVESLLLLVGYLVFIVLATLAVFG